MILQFNCERLHYLVNSHYIVSVYEDRLTIGKKTTPKYNLKLTLQTVLHWYVDGSRIQGFGIDYNNAVKFFKANHKDLDQLRNLSRNKICFDNIVEFYKQIDSDDPSRIQDQFTLHVYTLKCMSLNSLQEQVSVLTHINHPSIPQLKECFKYKSLYYMVMEFIGGITLQQYLTQHPKLSHLQCRAIIFQLLKVVNYLHDHCVIHATITLESIIYKPELIKITDFSQAKISNIIDPQDIYNCGAIMFRLYTGKELEKEDLYNFQTLIDSQTPKSAIELIMSMVSDDPISISEALQHPYFTNKLDAEEKRKRFQKIQRVQRSTSEMEDGDAKSQFIPELLTNKSKSQRHLLG